MNKLKNVKWLNDRLEHCACEAVYLSDHRKIESAVSDIIARSGLSIVERAFYQFNRGYTCVWLFKQSHLSLHSWPEYNFITLSIEVCNFEGEDESALDKLHAALLDFFQPRKSNPTKRVLSL